MAGIFCDVLKLEQVATEDNFFELGGHSLLATQVASRVRHAFSIEMSVRKLFEYPTVAELSRQIDALRGQASVQQPVPSITPATDRDRSELSYAQSRLWFLDQLEPDSNAYNIPLALSLQGSLCLPALEQGLGQVLQRHKALRTVFLSEVGEPRQLALPYRFSTLPVIDLTNLDQSQCQHLSISLIADQAARSFDLSTGPLIRASLIKQDQRSHLLALTMHHIVSDGWSTGILFKELSSLYDSSLSGAGSQLVDLPVQYADFAHWQRRWLRGQVLDSQLSYWKQQLSDLPVLELPTDRPRPPVRSDLGALQRIHLSAPLTHQLKQLEQAI